MAHQLRSRRTAQTPRRNLFPVLGALGLSGLCLLVGCNALFSTPQKGNTNTTANRSMNPTDKNTNYSAARPFYEVLDESLQQRGLSRETVCDESDSLGQRVLTEYGALFVVHESVKAPPTCVFADEAAVNRFQQEAAFKAANLGNGAIELQPAALDALLAARADAQQQGLSITPRGGDAARRSFATTLRLWESRFTPGLAHWLQMGRISASDAAQVRQMEWRDQVRAVIEWEKHGLFFSKDLSKSVFYSVAAPGTSQHLSMLALDVAEFGNLRVRAILAEHGWFQTVQSDLPHFTYLGWPESELPARGLRQVKNSGQTFWIPNISQ